LELYDPAPHIPDGQLDPKAICIQVRTDIALPSSFVSAKKDVWWEKWRSFLKLHIEEEQKLT